VCKIFSKEKIPITSIKDKAQYYVNLKVQVVIVLVLQQSIHIREEHGLASFPSFGVFVEDVAQDDVRNDLPFHSIDR
jgi:hypothetical protein